jgi:hypothetical protein
MKVTDRRMFTPEGELRQEYRHLEDAAPPAVAGSPAAEPPAAERAEEAEQPPPPQEDPAAPADEPSILELVRLLAENASIHLQQAEMPDGRQSENLDLAKLYIDLLSVLKKKTDGNLTAREDTVLGDVLYQLRLGYAERRGF